MLRKIIGSAMLLSLAHLAIAAGYPDKVAPITPVIYVKRYAYNCNWAYDIVLQRKLYDLQKHHIVTVLEPYSMRLIIPNYVLFKPADVVLREEAAEPLSIISSIIKDYPGANIFIYSYVDDATRPEDAKILTSKRAQQVAGFFWLKNIPSQTQTLHYAGKSSADPIANSQTIAGITDNRRVEIMIKLPH